MKAITDFSVLPLGKEGHETCRSDLYWLGEKVRTAVQGIQVEAQYSFDQGYLLFLSEACPYEEKLSIYLLDFDFGIRDTADLGQSYTPGVLQDVEVCGALELSFSFFGGDRWGLRVGERMKLDLRRLS